MKFIYSALLLTLITANLMAQQIGGNQQLPSIDLTTMDGEQVDLQSYAQNDKITIFSFWATWCKPCKKELNNLKYLLPDWQKAYDAELVAISIDNSRTSRKVKSFVNGQRWSFDVLLDVNKKTKRELNFSAIPYAMIINKEGQIVYKHSGYKEGDEYKMEDKLKAMTKEEPDKGK